LIIRHANYPFIKVFKDFFSALKLFTHHDVPSVTLLPPRHTEGGVER
jgi:hypothetical protein